MSALEDQARAWLDNDYTGKMDADTMRFSAAEMVEAFKVGWSQRGCSAPAANEPGPYGIGSAHWPGLGKVVEEVAELCGELGKLIGSGGDRQHWTGDLVPKISNEMADVRAALDFMEEQSPALKALRPKNTSRHMWKLALFRSWQRNDPEDKWPQPERYGLPPRAEQ